MDGATDASRLVRFIEGFLMENYGPAIRDSQTGKWELHGLPEGIRLEVHPSVYHALLADVSLYSIADFQGGAKPEDKFSVPVKVTPEVGDRYWRLVVVAEKVLTGGRLGG